MKLGTGKRVGNALELRNYLNNIDEQVLKRAHIICTYSDDVAGGEADIVVDKVEEDHYFCEIVGGSEMV